MFDIRTEIGNFGEWRSVFLEMKYTGTEKVKAECSYCGDHIATVELNLEEVEQLASDKLLDKDIIDTIENFVKAAKKLL